MVGDVVSNGGGCYLGRGGVYVFCMDRTGLIKVRAGAAAVQLRCTLTLHTSKLLSVLTSDNHGTLSANKLDPVCAPKPSHGTPTVWCGPSAGI